MCIDQHGPALKSSSGCNLSSSRIMPLGTPTGIVVFFHGVKQNSQGPEVIALGMQVVKRTNTAWFALDQQGHGRSSKLGDLQHSKAPGEVTSLSALQQDALTFVRIVVTHQCLPENLPFVIAGHSMGGGLCTSIVATLQREYSARFRGFLLSAPALVFEKPSRAALSILKGLKSVLPSHWWIEKIQIASLRDSIRRDSAFEAVRADLLRVHSAGLPADTFLSILELESLGFGCCNAISVPFLISHGTEDMSCNPLGSRRAHALAITPSSCVSWYIGGKHNLLADLVRDESLVNTWCQFISKANYGSITVRSQKQKHAPICRHARGFADGGEQA